MTVKETLILLVILSYTAGGNAQITRVAEQKTQLDEFANILVRKYSDQDGLSEPDFKDFWTNVMGKGNSSTNEFTNSIINCGKNVNVKDQNVCKASSQCLGSSELFQLASTSADSKVDAEALKQICPLVLYQLETGLCRTDRSTHPEVKPAESKKKPSPEEVWGYGILFVTLISLSSLVGVSVMPLMGKAFYSKLLTGLVGLAVGSLSGSSVFHLIPQAFSLPDMDPEHNYLQTSMLIFAGVWFFFMVERCLKIVMDVKHRRSEEVEAKAKNAIPLMGVPVSNEVAPKLASYNVSSCPNGLDHARNNGALAIENAAAGPNPSEIEAIYQSQEQVIKASFGHQQKPHRRHSHEHMIHYKSNDSPIASVAWMIIFGDGLHNFIDGLSIGAAFNENIPTGISISVAVMCEELPHELGDFAVLLSAGMSMRQALLYNFLSACTCYVGLALGILLGEIEASIYIFALAGGMFLYISLVDMVPEMNEVVEEASKVSIGQALRVLFLQNVGIFLGVGALYVLARYQDQIRFG